MAENNFQTDVAHARKRVRRIGIVLIVSVLANLLFLMYAFVQKAEAERQRVLASENQKIALKKHKADEATIRELRTKLEELTGPGN